jgi:acyl-coenzyme A synthetase/AMP-(fatty) acid ligase
MDVLPRNPLYEQWLNIAATRRGEMAVRDLASGREYSFEDLRVLAEKAPSCPPINHSIARGLDLIIDVLRSWRDGSVLIADDGSGGARPSQWVVKPGICHLKVTSGSTGTPHHVGFRAEQLAADAAQIVSTMGLRAEWPNLGVISMAHSYGFSNLVLPLLLHGVPLWLLDGPLPEVLRRALRTEHPLTLPAVPAMWQAWNRVDLDFSPVRLAVSAGAPLPLALEAAVFARTGLKIHNFYGSSECGGIAYDRTATPRKQATLVGTPMDGVTVAVDSSTACLRINSSAVAEGYVTTGPAATDDNGPGGGSWLTQDLASVDEGGEIHLLGRSNDMISVAGHKLSPAVIEDVIHRTQGVRCCVVFGVPSPNTIRVEDMVACVNLAPGADLHVLKRAFNDLPSTYCPRHWWMCAELQPDVRGKIPRNRWRERWLSESSNRIQTPVNLHVGAGNPE